MQAGGSVDDKDEYTISTRHSAHHQGKNHNIIFIIVLPSYHLFHGSLRFTVQLRIVVQPDSNSAHLACWGSMHTIGPSTWRTALMRRHSTRRSAATTQSTLTILVFITAPLARTIQAILVRSA